ncbi:hypothetical protein PYCCODRAFT_1525951 [Trametes coccinea BRFM310]|uniref:PXA domain-containing protein n=1 Tax=Trametes coccinea (strain BRFM310) TaxID=1353009 RepID=A0A1Y2IY30_TRAC3|nr:hypothetical protein PYCCODRAFT_1525951 [Trametes coccinea BRFM310]
MTTAPPSARRLGPRSIQSTASSTHDKAYVSPWWTKITRYDKEFLPEITRILTAVLRALEARLSATDLSPLVFRDLPALLTQHWSDYRNAHAKLHTSYASGGAASLPQLFHQIQPHMAVSPDGVIDVVYVRQAVDHILKACLPPDDYEPETERYIVREIVLKVLVGSVLPRLTQPWFIHKLILDQLGPESPEIGAEDTAPSSPSSSSPSSSSARPPLQRRPSHHFSFQALAISVLSAVQALSGACLALLHAYRQARETIRRVNQSQAAAHHPSGSAEKEGPQGAHDRDATVTQESATSPSPSPSPVPPTPALPGSLSVPQKDAPNAPAIVEPPTTAPGLPSSPSSESVATFMSPPSQLSTASPPHGLTPSISPSPSPSALSRSPSTAPAESVPPPPPIPNYTHPPLTFLLTLLTPPPPSVPPSSTPTPTSSSSFPSPTSPPASTHAPPHAPHTTARALTHLLTLLGALLAPFLARLLPYLLYAHLLCAPTLAAAVRAARRTLFPDGWPAPPPVDPTPEEQAEMRVRVRRRLGEAVPGPLQPLLGPTPAARAATIDAALAPLDSQACNAHLAVFILDLVLLTVFPEMGVSEEG